MLFEVGDAIGIGDGDRAAAGFSEEGARDVVEAGFFDFPFHQFAGEAVEIMVRLR